MIVYCENCESKVDCEELAHYGYLDEESLIGNVFRFLKCKECNLPILVCQDDLAGPVEFDTPVVLYPPKDKIIDPNLPDSISRAFNEALICQSSKTYLATALLCRRTLEMICHDHKTKGRSLAQQLREMRDKGIIDDRLYEWAEALRISGNEAAHSPDVNIGREDAQDITDFTHALLEYVYTFRDKFNSFMSRREKANET